MNRFSNYLTYDWHALMPHPWANFWLVLVAACCGAVVGIERERKEKPTGTRTLALVSLGSCIFTLLSNYLGNRDGHIAANIISGIGFLGAGVIIHGRYGIIGLTSAATIWAMAAIGMTVGAGFAGAGIGLSLLVLLLLGLVGTLERRYVGPCQLLLLEVTFDLAGGKTLIRLEALLDEFDSPGISLRSNAVSGEHGTATIRYCSSHRHHRVLLSRIAEMPEMQIISRHAPPPAKSGRA